MNLIKKRKFKKAYTITERTKPRTLKRSLTSKPLDESKIINEIKKFKEL